MKVVCCKCGEVTEGDNLMFCSQCGEPLFVKCEKCGLDTNPGQPFCGHCGQKLQESLSHQAPEQVTEQAPEQVPEQEKDVTEATPPSFTPTAAAPNAATADSAPKDADNNQSGCTCLLLLIVLVVGVTIIYAISGDKTPAQPSSQPSATAEMTYQVGDSFEFGHYPADNPISWVVLERKDKKVLALALEGLDAKRYHYYNESTNWATCSLRKWLNTDFKSRAFSKEESDRLLVACLSNPDSPPSLNNVSGGPPTKDKVFLLSEPEAEKYLPIPAVRICRPTSYAIANGAFVCPRGKHVGNGWWWLRSPGYAANCAATIDVSGYFSLGVDQVDDSQGMVRPAIYLKL